MTFLRKLFIGWNFLLALPDLLALFKLLDERIREARIDRKVTDDVRTIHEAFDARDPDKLNHLFRSQ